MRACKRRLSLLATEEERRKTGGAEFIKNKLDLEDFV